MIVLVGATVAPARATVAQLPAAVASPGRWVSGDYTNAAGTRHYTLYLPAGYDPAKQHMLVVLLHGCTQDAADIARGTRITAHADRGAFLVLLPEQPAPANGKKCWNWYDPAHQLRDAGEPSIIAGVTARIIGEYPVDPDRVHLAGISAGAAMASLVAVAYPETYASIALHSGIPWRSAANVGAALGVMAKGLSDAESETLGRSAAAAMGVTARPIPALVIQGGQDKVVNPANGRASALLWSAMNRVAAGGDVHSSSSVCDAAGLENGYHFVRHTSGRHGREVVELRVEELGHAWSGGSADGTFTDERGIDAMREVIDFFQRHPRSEER